MIGGLAINSASKAFYQIFIVGARGPEEDANDQSAKVGILLGIYELAEAITPKVARRDEIQLI